MVKRKNLLIGLIVFFLVLGIVAAIEMRPRANINMTNYNITYVNCVRFNDATWQCTAYSFANMTAVQGNITSLWTNASSQEGKFASYLPLNGGDMTGNITFGSATVGIFKNATALWMQFV